VTNIHQLTSQSTTSCPTTWRSYRDHRLPRRHFTLYWQYHENAAESVCNILVN